MLALPFFIALSWSAGSWPVPAAESASPDAGTLVLQFAFFYLAVFSIYYLLSALVSRGSGFWAAMLMGLNPWFLHALGEAEGASVALALGTAAGLTAAAKTRQGHSLLIVLSGAVFAASVSAHGFSVTLAPILLLAYLYLNRARHKYAAAPSLGWFAAGYVLAAAGLFDGDGLFREWAYWMEIASGGASTPYAEGFSLEQLPFKTDLHLLIALWLLSAVLLFRARSREGTSGFAALWSHPDTRPYGFCLSLCFLYGLIVMTFEGGWGWNILGQSDLTVFSLPLAAIGLAGVLERGRLRSERFHKHAAALFLISLTLIFYPLLQGGWMQMSFAWGTLALWAVALLLLMQLPALKKAGTRTAVVVALILFTGMILTGSKSPGLKKTGPPETPPQLTQLI